MTEGLKKATLEITKEIKEDSIKTDLNHRAMLTFKLPLFSSEVSLSIQLKKAFQITLEQ